MGTINYVNRRTDTNYQHIKIYEANSSPGFGGWGVRQRTAGSTGESIVCNAYKVPAGTRLDHAAFMLGAADGGALSRYISVGLWKWTEDNPLEITREEAFNITEDDIDGTFQKDVKYTVTFDEIVVGAGEGASLGVARYYISFYGYNVTLYETENVDDDDGAWVYNGAAGYNINNPLVHQAPLALTAFNDLDSAFAFEVWGATNTWDQIDDGGPLFEYNEDWLDAVGVTYPYIISDWLNEENIIVDDANSAIATGSQSYIAVDLGAGLDPETP